SPVSQSQIRSVAENEQPKQEKVRKTGDFMMRPEAANQANQQHIDIKEQSNQFISKIDDVLNRLEDDDEIQNDGELSDIDRQIDYDDLDMTGINMVAQIQRHSSKDERVIS
ncbi:MAG: hypothetical protein ACKO96_27795, partial [Flammeovirgaceae bacterium]